MTRLVYTFRLAYFSEEQVNDLQETTAQAASDLVLTTLPDGQPSFKTLFATAFDESEATRKVEEYVSKTKYKDIENNKTL